MTAVTVKTLDQNDREHCDPAVHEAQEVNYESVSPGDDGEPHESKFVGDSSLKRSAQENIRQVQQSIRQLQQSTGQPYEVVIHALLVNTGNLQWMVAFWDVFKFSPFADVVR